MRKFKLPNNKNLMKNALNTILAGKINEKVRNEAIKVIFFFFFFFIFFFLCLILSLFNVYKIY